MNEDIYSICKYFKRRRKAKEKKINEL